MAPDPKPAKRIVAPKAGLAKVRAEGKCRACGRVPAGTPTDYLQRMHLVPKSGMNRGDDIDENIVAGCGSGTTGCHGTLTGQARSDPEYRKVAADLRRNLREEEYGYILAKKGKDWLNRTYPKGEL